MIGSVSTPELFGPITCLYRVKDFTEALALAKEYPPGQMQIVREGVEKQDLLEAA